MSGPAAAGSVPLLGPLVTGAAAVTPLGRDLETTRAALREGRSAILPVDLPEGDPAADGRIPAPAARILSFSTEPDFPKAKARRFDRASQFAVVSSVQALRSAGWAMTEPGRGERTGIVFGTGSAGATPLAEMERQMAVEGPDAASPFLFPYVVANAPASQAAIELGIKGPNVTLIQKDPAALNAALYSRLLLHDSRADAVLAGAADEWALPYHLVYERLRVLRNARRPGFCLAEGSSCILLEREESAVRRGAAPWARLAGTAFGSQPVAPYRRRASVDALARAMSTALAEAGARWGASRVGLVHLSANGFELVDEVERQALRVVFGNAVPPSVAVKLQIGENPCSGAAQLALAAADLRDDPSLGSVLVNSFGAGGNALSAVLARP